MTIDTIETDFRRKIGERVRLASEGVNRYRVFTPFLLEDGDHLAVVLRKEEGRWVLTDEGHTYMHLTYDLDEKDLQRGNRQKIISNALSVFSVEDRRGNFVYSFPRSSMAMACSVSSRRSSRLAMSPICRGNGSSQHFWRTSAASWKSRSRSVAARSIGTIHTTIPQASTPWIAG